jgi:thiazole biosynthesis enzyme
MAAFDETKISRAITQAYHTKLLDHLVNDVLVVGAGPAGLTAAWHLADAGQKVTIIERRLAPGGGIWGGGMAMSDVVIQEEAISIVKDAGIRFRRTDAGLHTVDSVELAAALILKALQAGVCVLNLLTCEDVCVRNGRVTGVVVNRTGISGQMHVDPITFESKAVIDGTGHDASVVEHVRRRGLLRDTDVVDKIGDGPMDPAAGEAFVVDRVCEIYPGLWVAGMSVSAVFMGPRMGPIFGGMLLSGRRVAGLVAESLKA